jgi:hypothetical protein
MNMNAKQRKTLDDCASQIGAIVSQVGEIAEAEEEKFDNLSEGLQQAESGQKIETAKDALIEAVQNLEEALAKVEEARDA